MLKKKIVCPRNKQFDVVFSPAQKMPQKFLFSFSSVSLSLTCSLFFLSLTRFSICYKVGAWASVEFYKKRLNRSMVPVSERQWLLFNAEKERSTFQKEMLTDQPLIKDFTLYFYFVLNQLEVLVMMFLSRLHRWVHRMSAIILAQMNKF